ncbi:hypothetical protein N7510_000352 [Penicillium lagena]|uniref:uncharacterized protein n=1 Tax=Penicillium lagena TaxID=94218 RepID=UPI0025410261|nr:uncharacterized protein N7510_000352 [Penicillium lagena]KAJ5624043.1 hypothetical protein N7510_000352 [Penicillium lagena]
MDLLGSLWTRYHAVDGSKPPVSVPFLATESAAKVTRAPGSPSSAPSDYCGGARPHRCSPAFSGADPSPRRQPA